MRKLSNFLAYLSLIFLLVFAILVGFSGKIDKLSLGVILLCLSLLITSRLIYKKDSLKTICKKLKTAVKSQDLDLKSLNLSQYTFSEIENLQQEYQQTRRRGVILILLGFFLG